MNILILANNSNGLYSFRKELLIELVKQYDVYVSVPFGKEYESIERIGCKLVKTNLSRRSTNPFKDMCLLFFYKKIIKKIRPLVVLTYTIKPNIYGGIASKSLKVPYIVNVTGLGTAVMNKTIISSLIMFLMKRSLSFSNKVFFQNQANQDFLISRIRINNYEVLPGSGVNLLEHKYIEYPKNNILTFITIGRIMKDKGINELLEAIKIIKEEGLNYRFILLGGYEDDYKNIIDYYTNNGWIEYFGFRDDVDEFLGIADAVIHPSYHEGTSNVLLEAAACGRPILASNVPGCINTFDDGVTGFAFQVKNSKAIVDAIKRFAELSYREREDMGKKGRKKIEKEFDRNIVVNKYISNIEIIRGKQNESL